ncbi:MAG: rod shape-determining protein MreC [Bacilli bacterium]|nr:rod shape-determining protein MreC [Bacilli bacterium]
MKKKKLEKKYILIIILISATLFLGFSATLIKTDRKLNPVEQIIKDTSLVVIKIVNTPIDFIKDKINETKEKKDLYKKYKELEKKVKETDLINAEKKELERELEEMKNLLDLTSALSEDSYLNATVINRNLGYWYNTITIDKGTNSGIKEDMAVITSEGLIGKIVKASNFTSTVKLLTSEDANNKTSIRIEVNDKYIYGLLTGYNKDTNTFTIEGISDNSEIPSGSFVTTTGMGNIFPSGILVGKVKTISKDHFDLARTIEIESAVDFNNISYVTVLKRKDYQK